MAALVVEIAKEGNKLKVSAFEKSKGVEHTLRHYIESNISFTQIDELCDQITRLLNKANHSSFLDNISDELRKIGQLLFDQLFPSEVKEQLRQTACKFLIFSIDEQLVQIPWELLHDGDSFLSVKFATGRVVRTRQKFSQNKLRGVGSPINMLVLADPTGDLDSAYREGINIRNELEKNAKSIKIHLKTTNIDSQFLKKNIRDYDLVHFAGHAEYDPNDPSKSGWILKDERFTSKDILTLGESGRFPMVVFSNACQSGTTKEWKIDNDYGGKIYGLANAFLLSGVKHYIGTFWRILDEPSAGFAKDFYQNILQDMPIGEAIRLARLKLMEKYGDSSIVWASYMLYGDPSVSISSYYSAFESKLTKKPPFLNNKLIVFSSILLTVFAIGLGWLSMHHSSLLSSVVMSEAPKNSLAVMSFTNLNKDADSDWLSLGMAGGVAIKIYGAKDINLIDRQLIENKQKEMNLPPGQGLDTATADKISRMFGANWMVLGDYQKIGEQIRVSTRLIDLRSGQEVASTQADGTLSELFKIQDKIAFFIIEKINSKVSEEDKKRISALTQSDNVTAYELMTKAANAFINNDYNKATEYCSKALDVDPNYFAAISGLGFIAERLGNKGEAKELYSKALKTAIGKGDKLKLMGGYFSLGNINLSLLQPDAAVENLNKSLGIVREIRDVRSEANILNSLSRAYLMKQDYAQAKQYASKSEIIAKRYQDQSLIALIDMTNGFIFSYGPDFNIDKALDYFTRAQNFYQVSSNQQGQTIACQQIARLKVQKGDYEGALHAAGTALVNNQQIKDRGAEAASYELIASVYQSKNEFGKSIEYYEKSLLINQEIKNTPGYKSDLYSLALINSIQTNYEKSFQYATTLLDESKKTSDYDTSILALDQMASLYKLRGQYSDALNQYNQAASYLDKTKNKLLALKIYQGLGDIYAQLGNGSESESNFKKAVNIAEGSGDQANVAHAYNEFAQSYQQKGDYSGAIELYGKAIYIIERFPTQQRNNYDLVSSYFGIAESYRANSDQAKAAPYFEKALQLGEKINSPILPSIKASKANLASNIKIKDEFIQNEEAGKIYDLALHKSIEGKPNEAAELLNKALILNGPNDKILSGLCLEYQRMGNYPEAIKTSKVLIDYFKKKNMTEKLVEQYCWQGYMENKAFNYKDALGLFDQAEKLAISSNYKRGLVMVYADSSEILEWDDPEKAMERAKKAIQISNEIADSSYVSNAYQTLSSIYSTKGQSDKAIEYAKLDLERAESTGIGDLGRTYAQVARAYKKVDMLKSIEYLNKAVDYFENKHDEQAKGNMFNELGGIYQEAKQTDKALDYYLKSVEIAERFNDRWTASASYIGLLSIYNDTGNKSKAEEYEAKFIKNINITHDQQKVGNFIGLLGDSKLKNDPSRAADYFDKSNQILSRYLTDDSAKKRIDFNFIGLATIQMDSKNLERAEDYILQGVKAIEGMNDKDSNMLKAFSYNLLAQNLAKNQKFDKARIYFSKILEFFKASSDKKGLAATYFQLGVMEGYLKNFDSSISMFESGLKLANETDDEELKKNILAEKARWEKYRDDTAKYEKETHKSEEEKIADQLVGTAVIYQAQKKYKAASYNLDQALEIYKTNKSKNGQIWVIGLQLSINLLQDQVEAAELNLKQYVDLANELNDKEFIGLSHGAKAAILEKRKDYKGAETELQKGIEILKDDAKTIKYQPYFLMFMGILKYKQGDIDKAISSYELSLKCDKRYIQPKSTAFASFALGYLYFRDNNVNKANEYLASSLELAQKIDDDYLIAVNNILLAILDEKNSTKYLSTANEVVKRLGDAPLVEFLNKYTASNIGSAEAKKSFEGIAEKANMYYLYDSV